MIPQNGGKVKPNPLRSPFCGKTRSKMPARNGIKILFCACPRALPKIRKMYCTAIKTSKIQTILYKTKGAKEENGAVRTNEQAPCSFVTFVRRGFFFFRFYANGKNARRKHEFS